MTKLSLIIAVLFLGVACGLTTNEITGAPWTPGAAGAAGAESNPEQELSTLVLVCPAGHVPNYISSALASAVETLAAEGALVAVGCGSDESVGLDMNPHRCAEREGAERSACIDQDGIHVDAESTPEHLAELVLEHALRQLLKEREP